MPTCRSAITVLTLFAGVILQTPAVQAAEGPVAASLPLRGDTSRAVEPVRGWILLVYDMPYLRETIRKAPQYGINHIQLSHDIVHFANQIIDDEQRRQDVRELVALGKSLGLQMIIWTHELSDVPDRFCVGVNRRVDLDNSDLWKWLADRYRRVYEVIPELDGVVVSLSETGRAAVTRESGVISKLERQRRVVKIGQVLKAVHKPLGKRVIIRDFGETLWARQGILICEPDIWAMTKVVYGDWQPYCEHSITYDYYGDRPLLVEFDLCGEFIGQSVIPWCDPAYVKYRWDHAITAGSPAGAVARIGRQEMHRFAHRTFGTPNEINIEMFCRLMRDPQTDPDIVWKHWTEKTYGHAAATIVESALRRSAEFTRRIYWGDRLADYRIQQHSFIPTFEYALDHDREYMQTCPVDPELFLLEPEFIESEMSRRYDPILPFIDASIADIERARTHLRAEQYQDLKQRLEMTHAATRAFKAVHKAFIRYVATAFARTHADVYSDALHYHRTRIVTDLADLEDVAAEIEKRFGARLDLASAERIRAFANGLKHAYDKLNE